MIIILTYINNITNILTNICKFKNIVNINCNIGNNYSTDNIYSYYCITSLILLYYVIIIIRPYPEY